MEEGDKLGGWRDRLMLAELSIKDTNRVVAEIKAEIKMKIYWASAIGGLVGGLMAVLTKDSLQFILNILMNWIK